MAGNRAVNIACGTPHRGRLCMHARRRLRVRGRVGAASRWYRAAPATAPLGCSSPTASRLRIGTPPLMGRTT